MDPVTERLDAQNEDLLLHDDGSEPEKSLRLKGNTYILYMEISVTVLSIIDTLAFVS